MYNTGDAMRLITFKRTICPNIFNKTLRKDLITIITTVEEIVVATLGIRIEERQTSPVRKVIRPTMQLIQIPGM